MGYLGRMGKKMEISIVVAIAIIVIMIVMTLVIWMVLDSAEGEDTWLSSAPPFKM